MSARWLAWALSALTLGLIACAVVLALLNRYSLWDLTFLVAQASAALVGGLIASRRPRNPVGWFIIGHALCFTLGEFSRQYAIHGLLTEPGSLPAATIMASPPYWIWFPGLILMFSFLPLYFPNGHLVSRRWRPVAWLAVFLTASLTIVATFRPGSGETRGIPNPLGIEVGSLLPQPGVLEVVLPGSWLVLGAASAASLVVRFVRSRGEERQQLKWFAYAVVMLISYSFAEQLFLLTLTPSAVTLVLGLVVLEGLWVAIAVAILRYRLYEIDLLINRTLVYGSLTASLALVYLGSVVALQGLFRALTGQGSQLAVVASTLAIAALFNPLRRRLQAFIDQRFYRRKYDARKALEAFGARLRDETDLNALNDELVAVVRETVQPAHVSLWLRPASTPQRSGEGEPDELSG
ncbi:MAG: hypothetical protein M3N09_06945 [Actinomycetota bacterium]|nr:hypothetical protein [Actinomycetota bacterium]